jgi:hypothetical protein
MGGGSTLAAADNVGYESVGVEIDKMYYDMAVAGVPLLAALYPSEGEVQTALEADAYTERLSQAMLFS